MIAGRGLSFQVRFTQKVNLIGTKLVVAWCGAACQARRALQALTDIEPRPDLGRSNILNELESLDLQQPLDQLQLVGFLLRAVNGRTVEGTRFCWGVEGIKTSNLGVVFAAGSGRDSFLGLLAKNDWTNSGTGNEFQVAHALLGALINQEYRTGHTITERWGGGFEAVAFSLEDRRFKKVGDILHTFWQMKEGSYEAVQCLPMFYKTTYWRDALIIRSALFDAVGEGAFKLTRNDLDLIPPLLKDTGEYDLGEIGPVDFSYRAICCHVLIEKPDNRDIMLMIDQRDGEPLVNLEIRNDGSGRLHISQETSKVILGEARARAALTHPLG